MEDKIYTDFKEMLQAVEKDFNGESPIFLNISNQLLDDVGINMAILGDLILRKGYYPDGREEIEGYKRFKYAYL